MSEPTGLIKRLRECLPMVGDGMDDKTWCSVLGADLREAIDELTRLQDAWSGAVLQALENGGEANRLRLAAGTAERDALRAALQVALAERDALRDHLSMLRNEGGLIATLRAEATALRAERDALRENVKTFVDADIEWQDEMTALEAERDALKAGLPSLHPPSD